MPESLNYYLLTIVIIIVAMLFFICLFPISKKIKISSISSSECTLEDVFLSYTGKNLRDEERSSSQLTKHSKRGSKR